MRRQGLGAVVLRASGVTKSYAGVRALRGATMELRAGEVHALVGENGAGKSTLAKILTGAVARDGGRMEVGGTEVGENSPTISRGLGIAAIYQHPALFAPLSVAENIALALETGRATGSGRRAWRVDWRERERRAEELLETLGARIDVRRAAGTLSMAEQQMVEIAKAVGAEARVLLMDEPTALLSSREVDRLFGLVERFRAEGVAMVYVSHRLEEVLALADRITVLRDGETVACREAEGVSRGELIELMVGRRVEAVYPKRAVAVGEVVLEVEGLEVEGLEVEGLGGEAAGVPGGLREISFTVRAGEIFGVGGLVGSGRTELARTLFGVTPGETEIGVGGWRGRVGSVREAIARGMGYLPEDRRQHGVVGEMDVAANISLASPGRISRGGLMDGAAEREMAEGYVGELRIKTAGVYRPVSELSGGNQQKVALARWMATEPKVMILDEPTQGVDVGSKAEIHELILQMAERGVGIVMISSELPELLGMSDRIGVMRGGRMVGVLSREEATQERVISMAFGRDAVGGEEVEL